MIKIVTLVGRSSWYWYSSIHNAGAVFVVSVRVRKLNVTVMGIYKKPAFVKVAIQIEEKIASRNVGVRKRFRAFRREVLTSTGDCFKWILWNARKRK